MDKKSLFSLIDKGVWDYDMIQPGDRILLGISGGKDSTALAEYFANRLRRQTSSFSVNSYHHPGSVIPFSFSAVFVQTEFSGSLNERLLSLLNEWQIAPIIEKVNVLGRLKRGRHMNCWWCSTQRRVALLDYAMQHGFNKIALGHHLDDILETLLMNMLNRGKLETMPPVLKYEKYPLSVIRPLCYVPVSKIILHAESEGWRTATCTCSYQDNSGRKDARNRLEILTDGDESKKMRLFKSLQHIDKDYLP